MAILFDVLGNSLARSLLTSGLNCLDSSAGTQSATVIIEKKTLKVPAKAQEPNVNVGGRSGSRRFEELGKMLHSPWRSCVSESALSTMALWTFWKCLTRLQQLEASNYSCNALHYWKHPGKLMYRRLICCELRGSSEPPPVRTNHNLLHFNAFNVGMPNRLETCEVDDDCWLHPLAEPALLVVSLSTSTFRDTML
eukprot:4622282-Amphidinium_carterae.1